MTEQTRQTHTKTPWKVNQYNDCITTSLEDGIICERPYHKNFTVVGHAMDWEENAKLICASVNSYSKHCGPRAVELAEADLLGEALEACKEAMETEEMLQYTLSCYRSKKLYDKLKSVLSKIQK